MPPRKSNVSQISATDPEGGGTPLKERDGINIEVQTNSSRICQLKLSLHTRGAFRNLSPIGRSHHSNSHQDLSLPRTMVQRLAKGVLPPNTSLHKDAILAMSKGATVFINYLAQA